MKRLAPWVLILCLAMLGSAPGLAQEDDAPAGTAAESEGGTAQGGGRMEPTPAPLEGVGITENLGAPLPLDVPFRDEDGREVTLGSYLTGDRPVILVLGYYTCPMLCNVVLNGLTEGLQGLPFSPGREFDVVVASIDPTETPTLARLKKQTYVKQYGRPATAGGWHFLTGQEPNIRQLADRVGFHYKLDEKRGEYAHSAAIYVTTPDGVLSRYLYGVMYEPRDLRLALLEASDGKIGSTVDRILLFCYHYDPLAGTYAPTAMKIMTAGALLTVVVLGILLAVFWRRERRRKRTAAAAEGRSEAAAPAGRTTTT